MSGRDESDRTLMKPDPIKAPLVTKLFEDFATGLYSQQDVLHKYKTKGLKLERSALSRMLENPLYMGMVKVPAYKDEPEILVEGLHIPLVTKEIFYRVQNIKNGRRDYEKKPRGRNENFPLTGFLVCPECGKIMYGSASNNGRQKKVTRTYNYYQCNSKQICKRYRVELVHQELDKIFSIIKPSDEVLRLFECILIDEYKNTKTDRLKDISNLDKKIEEINNNQLLLTEKYGLDKIKEEIYNKLIENYERELIELKAAKAELGDYQEDLDKFISFGLTMLTNLAVFYHNTGIDVKTKLIGSIFSEKLQFFENTLGKYNSINSTNKLFSEQIAKLNQQKIKIELEYHWNEDFYGNKIKLDEIFEIIVNSDKFKNLNKYLKEEINYELCIEMKKESNELYLSSRKT